MAVVDGPDRPTGRWPLFAVVLVLAIAVAAAGGIVAGSRLHGNAAIPDESSVDVGFARDMQTHHAQAVEMSTIVRERSEDQEIRAVALDIALTQQHQIGQMYAWLDTWGHSRRAGEQPMTWMQQPGHAGHTRQDDRERSSGPAEPMPGMATATELRELDRSQARTAELLFLRMMIEHHQGGIEMADFAAAEAEQPQVRHLARVMADAQRAEVTAMREMIRQRTESDGADRENDAHQSQHRTSGAP